MLLVTKHLKSILVSTVIAQQFESSADSKVEKSYPEPIKKGYLLKKYAENRIHSYLVRISIV